MSNKKTYCVYIHISPNNKRYIGITCQKPNRRWQNGKGYVKNIHFTNAINKYGWDNFQHIIICKGLDKEVAKWLEIELIREWNTTNPSNGYNITKGGDGGLCGELNGMYDVHLCGENHWNYGKHHSEATRKKISESHIGMTISEKTRKKMSENNSGKNNPRAKAVICITTMKIFDTAKEASEFYKDYRVSRSGISQCCNPNDKRKSCGKLEDGTPLIWMKYEDYLKITEK